MVYLKKKCFSPFLDSRVCIRIDVVYFYSGSEMPRLYKRAGWLLSMDSNVRKMSYPKIDR